jgi:hypothetical protein
MKDDFTESLGKRMLKRARGLEEIIINSLGRIMLWSYHRSDRRPWRPGYKEYKAKYLSSVLGDAPLLKTFREGQRLPKGYGFRLDCRAVEIPWVLSRLNGEANTFLDAGSSLNYSYLLATPVLRKRKVTILTLAPEFRCFWHFGISYVFSDLRDLLFRNDCFQEIACISTIEHVGMDTGIYTGHHAAPDRQRGPKEYLRAIKELKRVLKPGGTLYITVPFGRYEDHGWLQQFDAELTDELIAAFGPRRLAETIFRYQPTGWQQSDRVECAQCQFFDVFTSRYFDPDSTIEFPSDYRAGEGAVACLELHK